MDTFPSGAAKLAVICPHCQTTTAVQFPPSDHVGDIKAECGQCGQPFTFASPHGAAEPAPAPTADPGTENVVLGDAGSGTGA